MLTARNNDGKSSSPIPAGVQEAVCYTICDLGTTTSEYQGNINEHREVVLIWEIPALRIQIKDKDTGETKDLPRVISKRYTLSLGEKANLRHDLASWRTRDFTPIEEKAFSLNNVLGASCMLNIMHKNKKKDGSAYAVVNAVLPLKGKKIIPENPLVLYGIEEHGKAIPESLPKWIVEEIQKSPEYQNLGIQLMDEPPPATDDDAVAAETEVDEIPFD